MVVDVWTSGLPDVSKIVVVVKQELSLKRILFCVSLISGRSLDCHNVEVNLVTISVGHITQYATVVCVTLAAGLPVLLLRIGISRSFIQYHFYLCQVGTTS